MKRIKKAENNAYPSSCPMRAACGYANRCTPSKKIMKIEFIIIGIILLGIGCSKQFVTLVIEKEKIDSNNEIYKPGNVFIYDYEIIRGEKRYKLKNNNSIFNNSEFEFVPIESSEKEVDKIHMIVKPVSNKERINKNQTQIYYLQEPIFSSMSGTGLVENDKNVWIHPIREGFFNCLETGPYPYVQFPLEIGKKWTDEMRINENWRNEIWGKWDGKLEIRYEYEVMELEVVETEIGKLECYKVNSKGKSKIGTTKLRSYFSKEYGFIRMEYDLVNDLKVNMWLVDFKSGKEFSDIETFFKTKEYLKK